MVAEYIGRADADGATGNGGRSLAVSAGEAISPGARLAAVPARMASGEPPHAADAATSRPTIRHDVIRRRRSITRVWRLAGPGSRGAAEGAPRRGSVPVVLGLVRPRHVDADVLGLVLRQLGAPDAKGVQVQPGDLLVEDLRQAVHTQRVGFSGADRRGVGYYLVGVRFAQRERRATRPS